MHTKNIYNENWKFWLRGKNSVCAGAFQLLRARAPAQLRENIVLESTITANDRPTVFRAHAWAHVSFLSWETSDNLSKQ
jgi:hypothetical protein